MIYDIGEQEMIRPTKENLARFMEAVLVTGAEIVGVHSTPVRNGEWLDPPRARLFYARISIDDSQKDNFERIFDHMLTDPEEVGDWSLVDQE